MNTIVSIVREEDAFIKEWIAYHKMIGFDHFYIYDNDKKPSIKNILGHLNFVTIIPFHDDVAGLEKQYTAYNHSLSIQNKNNWAAYIDVDEFILLSTKYSNIDHFITENKKSFSCLSLQWYVFGNNGYLDSPPSITKYLTKRINYEESSDLEYYFYHRKNIAKIKDINSINNPHEFNCKTNIIDPKEARINHYFARSTNTFLRRADRGDVLNKKRSKEDLEKLLITRVELANAFEDYSMDKLQEALEKTITRLF